MRYESVMEDSSMLGRRKLNAFWDSGAQNSMVTHKKAAECSLTLVKAPPLEVTAYGTS